MAQERHQHNPTGSSLSKKDYIYAKMFVVHAALYFVACVLYGLPYTIIRIRFMGNDVNIEYMLFLRPIKSIVQAPIIECSNMYFQHKEKEDVLFTLLFFVLIV